MVVESGFENLRHDQASTSSGLPGFFQCSNLRSRSARLNAHGCRAQAQAAGSARSLDLRQTRRELIAEQARAELRAVIFLWTAAAFAPLDHPMAARELQPQKEMS